MNDLLELALDAHGGLDRWNKFNTVSVDMSLGGLAWTAFGHPDNPIAKTTYEAQLRSQRVSFNPFRVEGQTALMTPGAVSISEGSKVLELLTDPRASYEKLERGQAWTVPQLLYFISYAVSTYLTIPFIFTLPGFVTEEIEPWEEAGEVWRRLKVTFPENWAYHTREQLYYFDCNGLLKRNDYQVDIIRGNGTAHYVFDYADFQGIKLPTRRHVYGRDENRQYVKNPMRIDVKMNQVKFA